MKVAPRPADEALRLATLHDLEVLDSPDEATFDDFARLAALVCGTPIALVSFVDADRQWFKSRVGLDTRETPRDLSFCAHAILVPEVMVVPDARADDRFSDNPGVAGDPYVRFYAGAPLRVGGHAVGTLCVVDTQPRRLTPEQLAGLEALAARLVDHLQLRRRAKREAAQRARADEAALFLRELHRVATAEHDSPEAFLADYLRTAASLLELPVARLAALDGTLILGDGPDLERAASLAAHVATRAADEADAPSPLRAWIGAPVLAWGEPRATLIFAGAEPRARPFGPADLELVDVVAARIGRRIELQEAEAARAAHDAELSALKDEFVATVSHELRTPLTSIRGALGLLESGVLGVLATEAKEVVGIARNNTERLIRLINDMLDLEKMQAGRLELALQKLDPTTLVSATVAGLLPVARAAGVTLQEVSTSTRVVSGDMDRLIQVLTNFVSNAIKFSPRGKTVAVRTRDADGGVVRFEVEDGGPGIPADKVDRLFQKFQQLDGSDSRSRGGTGLGLAISRTLIERHGGRVGVDSAPGQGAVFWAELPGVAREAVAVSGQWSLLVVEDNADIAWLVQQRLSGVGYRVTHAGSLSQARSALSPELPDAVLLDVGLPDGSGLELVADLRRREGGATVPVVVVSGEERAAHERPEGVEWLVKPVDHRRLLQAVRRALRSPGPPRALIIDDDEGARRVLVTQLRALGVVCTEAPDGAEALRAAREIAPDLIVLDLGLPGLDGYDVVAALRTERSGGTPLLVYTGRDLSAADRRALTLGTTRHLTKARVTPDEFLEAARELLNDLLVDPA